MCDRCVVYATDLMWDRARGIVAIPPNLPGAPPIWLDQLNVAFWRGFREHRYGMRSRLPEIAQAAMHRIATVGGTAVTPREVANYINCQWLASFAENFFGKPDWLRGAVLAFDLLVDDNDPFLQLIARTDVGNDGTHTEVINFSSPHDNAPNPTESPHDGTQRHRPRF